MRKGIIVLSVVLLLFAMNFVSAEFYSRYDFSDDDYGSSFNFGRGKYDTNTYKETTEYKKTTEDSWNDRWSSGSIKRTYSDKVEIRTTNRDPRYYRYDYDYAPYSSWRYKEPARYSYGYYSGYNRYDDARCGDYDNSCRRDYYYAPRYDHQMGHYNWRY